MGIYIHYFDSASTFDEEYWGSGYTEPWVSYIDENEEVNYNKSEDEILLRTPFTIEALGSGDIKWKLKSKSLQYSKNGGEWTAMTSATTIPVVAGDEVAFKGANSSYSGCSFSASTADFNVKGNIMSLTNGDNFLTASTLAASYTFNNLFRGCEGLSSAGKLSDSWTEPVAVTVAERLVATIADSSLVEKTVIEDEVQRQTLSLTEMPLSVTTQGAGEGGETIVAIERVGDYHMARPDETKYDGFDGETIAKVETIGDGAIEIDTSDLILALDDGASYKVVVTIKDGLGQTASAEQEFEVHWDHQAVIPEAAVRVDQENYAAIIDLLVPEGAIGTDRCDIYRLSMDRPELIVRDGIPGQKYVDPYPTIGSVGGHRVVFKTKNGDYITEDNMPAWVDLGVEEDDTLDINDNIIDFDISSRMVRFDIHMNNMQRRNNQMYATQVDMLRKNVQNIPIPKDPLSFQKFQQSVKNMIAEINKTDKQYEEFLNFIYEMDGVLESLENTQATKMQQKIVFERINQMVEAMNDINQKDSIDNMSGKELKERLGIKEKQEVQEVQTEQQYEEQEEENININ